MSNVDNCCNEETNYYNPKKDKGHKRYAIAPFIGINNPIPAEITDDELQTKVWDEYKLIPFAGTNKGTGNALLLWYLMLAKLSPTHNACIVKKTKYAVGGRVYFERATDPNFDIESEAAPLTKNEQTQYRDALTNLVSFDGGIRKFHKLSSWNYQYSGNAFVEVAISRVLGEARASIKLHKTTTVMYRRTDNPAVKVVAISPVWNTEYLKKYPPRYVPTYPNFVVDETGVERTVFHLKSNDNEWYGRPETEGSDLYKYRELQDAIYLIKQSAGNFLGQVIIEVEDDDPETAPAVNDGEAQDDGFNSFSDRIEKNFTNKGDDPQTVLITSRPYGSRPMVVHQIKPNTNESWYKVNGEISENKILRAHGCTLRFMGFETVGGLGNDAFMSDYIFNMQPVIRDLRETIVGFTNEILNVVWERISKPEFSNFAINCRGPIDAEIDAIKEQTNNIEPTTNSGQ